MGYGYGLRALALVQYTQLEIGCVQLRPLYMYSWYDHAKAGYVIKRKKYMNFHRSISKLQNCSKIVQFCGFKQQPLHFNNKMFKVNINPWFSYPWCLTALLKFTLWHISINLNSLKHHWNMINTGEAQYGVNRVNRYFGYDTLLWSSFVFSPIF